MQTYLLQVEIKKLLQKLKMNLKHSETYKRSRQTEQKTKIQKKTADLAAKLNGRIDIWVNNVGTNKPKRGEFYEEDEIDLLIGTLYKSALYGIQNAVPYMKEKGGSIVNISSLAARCATCGRSNLYASMKAALLALTRTSAGEYAKYKIRVNAILPGYTRTPLVEKGFSKEMLEKLLSSNVTKRMAEPEEIAKPVVFVSSEAASYINGESIEVSGGQNIVLNAWEG